MKRIVAIFAFLMFLAGCTNDNKITINNLAEDYIYFNFRAQKYTLASQETIVITDIPNGTFAYGASAELPSNATSGSFEGNASDGILTFEKKRTQILMIYGSMLTAGGAYSVNLNTTSSMSTTTTASVAGLDK
jgi:hypothetical protein